MSRSARTHPHPDLFDGLEPAAGNATSAAPADLTAPVAASRSRARDPVWLCVHFPSLPLQALQSRFSSDRPAIVCDTDQQRCVVATNRLARRLGVLPGQSLKTALALCADPDIADREPIREQALLADIAQRLLAFSTMVSLVPPQSVLVELRASLKLFGGIDALCERLLGQLGAAGYHLRHSLAPTATAAHWLALAACAPPPGEVVTDGRHGVEFLQRLNDLDIALTGWPPATIAALQQMGIERIGDCRRLPRDGLTRRFGPEPLYSLAQAFGELPEVRRPVTERQQFESLRQLDAEIADAGQLLAVCEQLGGELEVFLRRRQMAVRRLHFEIHGWRGRAGELSLSMSGAGFERGHWQGLLEAHLERCRLTQPAVAVALHADASEPLQVRATTLALESDATPQAPLLDRAGLSSLPDRLQARIGEDAVHALRHVSEHRPEYASRTVSAADATQAAAGLPDDWLLHDVPAGVMTLTAQRALLLQRPLWMTEAPLPLHLHDGVLYREGALQLRHGPERIESGWWDGDVAVRDYFIAENPTGTRLWVFRESDASGATRWWLHGVFG